MKKLVIIGGGFAGAIVARKLEKEYNTTLIDTKDYFEFTPGILRSIVEPTHLRKIQVMHSHYLHRTKIIRGVVEWLDNNKIVLKNGDEIVYDYLVIASGSKYSTPIKEDNLVLPLRADHLRENYGKLCKSEKVLIIGGGLVGVELTAEIVNKYKNKEVTLVHLSDRLLERNSKGVSKYVYNYLTKKGVKIIFNEKIIETKLNGKTYHTDKGRTIHTNIAFLANGIRPNSEFLLKNFENSLNEKKHVKVNKYLQMEGMENIFVPGDVNNLGVEKTAQNANAQAKIVIKNIRRMENKKELIEYSNRKTPLVISLGKYNGLFILNNFYFSGIIPGLMKKVIEMKEMIPLKFF